MKEQKNHKKRGFTLLEMIIAVGLLSVMSVGILKVFLVARDLNQKSYDLYNSMLLTKNIVALIDDGSFPSTGQVELSDRPEVRSMIAGERPGEYLLYLDKEFKPLKKTTLSEARYIWKMNIAREMNTGKSGELYGEGLYHLSVSVDRNIIKNAKTDTEKEILVLNTRRFLSQSVQ